MPTFKIEEYSEAKLASVTTREEHHGKDTVTGMSIGVIMKIANTDLDQINPEIRDALFKPKNPDQVDLPEVGGGTPIVRCNSFGAIPINLKLTGWVLEVDDGMEGTEPLVFGKIKADKFRVIEVFQGGAALLGFRLGTNDIDANRFGKLGMHLGQSIWIKLTPPAPAIDGSAEGGGPGFGEPDEDATSLFAGSGDEQPAF
jgi:hypothetical protein